MFSVVIAAAGMGSRMNLGYNKLLWKKDGQTLIEQTVSIFLNDQDIEEIILVCSKDDLKQMETLFKNKVTYVIGGNERQTSVFEGLKQVKSKYVMIHDGARPYVTSAMLCALKDKVREVGAVLPVVSVKDTIKVVQGEKVVQTLERATLKQAQTPQVFLTKAIFEAHLKAEEDHFLGTDDASLYEKFIGDVYVVEGDYLNIKVTTPDDLK